MNFEIKRDFIKKKLSECNKVLKQEQKKKRNI